MYRQEAADRLLGVMLELAAWIKCCEPADCGYASHTAIFREHTGRISVTRFGDTRVWLYLGRAVVAL